MHICVHPAVEEAVLEVLQASAEHGEGGDAA